MSDAKKTPPNARKKAVGAEIEARKTTLTAQRRSCSTRCANYMSAVPKLNPSMKTMRGEISSSSVRISSK